MSRLDRLAWCPRLRRGFRIAPADDGNWQVRWDFDEVAFLDGQQWGEVLPWLVPLLDGTHTLDELQTTARDRKVSVDLAMVIEQLETQGFLADDDESAVNRTVPDSLGAAVESMGRSATDVLARVNSRTVVVYGKSELAECLARSIARHGCCVQQVSAWEGKFAASNAAACMPIVVETDWRPDELDDMNDQNLAARRPWMIVGAWNARVLVGPIFVPGETACYTCYRRRLDSHRRYQAAYSKLDAWRRSEAVPADPEAVLPGVAELAAAWTALELFAHLGGGAPPRTLGRVLVYHPREGRMGYETVLRIPWCSKCSCIRI